MLCLYVATAFGQLWRLEPLPSDKKQMWRREMECLLCVSDHIVEFKPSWQTLADGSRHEVIFHSPLTIIDLTFSSQILCLKIEIHQD